MIRECYVPHTLAAQFRIGMRVHYAFWPTNTRLAVIAAYCEARRLRLRWDAGRRALLIDTGNR